MTTPLEWGEVDLRAGEEVSAWSFGPLTLYARRKETEILLRTEHDGVESSDWVRWHAAPETRFELRPALPDRAIVVAPERPYRLPQRGESEIYVGIPMFVRVVSTIGGAVEVLADYPSEVLSDTWWGGFTEGELAYWVETRARRAVPTEPYGPNQAVCPFHLVNESSQALPVERFSVRVDHLSLFSTASGVWTDEVSVRYAGPDEGSEIHHTGRAPRAATSVKRLAGPRTPPPSGLRGRTFSRLKALAWGER